MNYEIQNMSITRRWSYNTDFMFFSMVHAQSQMSSRGMFDSGVPVD